MKSSNKILAIMLACAVVAMGFGFFVLRSRSSNSLPDSVTSAPETTPAPAPEADVPTSNAVIPSDWKVYTNTKHGFTVIYPPYLKAGSVSDNSVLGTYQVPVKGLHVGPLLFIALKDADLKKQAQEMFQGLYDAAKNPKPAAGAEGQAVECKIDLENTNQTRTGVTSLKAVSCNGEGGAARYAYIAATNYDFFVDGYSKGYDNQSNGEIKNNEDYLTILNTFTFGDEFKDWGTAQSPTSTVIPTSTTNTTTTTTTTATTTTPTIQQFTINADDISATPSEITVTKGSIVQITFVIGTNTYYGGLEFKSSVVNSGVINAGQSKTISFKAVDSFEFTPYWPSSNITKGYKIKVIAQ
ncbi:MAG: hypothetical protein KW802_02160 [Candidatus Doudnabacteria bacterium]|nr:hypothetical protein [Candidatus Doudnabacteria bacterium]